MGTNQLAMLAIRRGIDPTPLRDVFRQLRIDMIAGGPGTSIGIEGFGVFFVQHSPERFVMRDGLVFKIPERDEIKLRPSKATVELLAESEMVELATVLQGPIDPAWVWQSTSRASRFTLVLPLAFAGLTYEWVRIKMDGQRRYCMVEEGFLPTGLDLGHDMQVAGGDHIGMLRFTAMLDNDPGTFGAMFGMVVDKFFTASLAGTSAPTYLLADPLHGKEVLAWWRQRAVDESERA